MEELMELYDKYQRFDFQKLNESKEVFEESFDEFIEDFSIIIDNLARMYNEEAFPNHYDINESTVVGAIARIVKLFKECVHLYKTRNDDVLGLVIRPLFETTIIVRYLITKGTESQKNFRLVSYKSRYQNYKKLMADEELRSIPAGQRLIEKLNVKLDRDGFSIDDLETEQSSGRNKWKLDGKNFYEIHREVGDENHYSFIYGVGSDSIHGNWQEIIDYHLVNTEDDHFTGYHLFEVPKCISLIPVIKFVMHSFTDFLNWNSCWDDNSRVLLQILTLWNEKFYSVYEDRYSESAINTDRS